MPPLLEVLVASAVLAVPVVLALAAYRARRNLRSCCAPADPRTDLRMRAAFEDEPTSTVGVTPEGGSGRPPRDRNH